MIDKDCKHNSLTRMEDAGQPDSNLYSCDNCGDMFTTDKYEIEITKGTKKEK